MVAQYPPQPDYLAAVAHEGLERVQRLSLFQLRVLKRGAIHVYGRRIEHGRL